MSFRDVLDNDGFRRLWLAQVVSRIGDSVHEIALIWLAYDYTGDPAILSLVVVASLAPVALSSLPAGVLVDWWDRKLILAITSIARGFAVLLIPLAGRFAPSAVVPTVLGVAFFTGLMEAFFGPAKTASIPALVGEEELDTANSLSQMTSSTSRILYALGGLAVSVVGSFSAFYIDAVSFLVAGALIVSIPEELRSKNDGKEGLDDFLQDTRDGISYILGNKVMLSVILLSVLTGAVLAPLGVVLPVFAETVLGGGSVMFGVLYATIFTGALLGGICVDAFDGRVDTHRGRIVVTSAVGMGVVLTVIGLAGRLPLALLVTGVSFVLFGVFYAFTRVPVQTLAQRVVPDERRGRVFSVWTATGLIAPPISVAVTGAILSVYEVEQVILAQGVLVVCLSALLVKTPLWGVARRESVRSHGD